MKKNYKLLMDCEIEKIKKTMKRPSLLLHACCAPCSSAVLETLNEYFNITLYFYNPNIYPESEYDFRYKELKRLCDEMGLCEVNVICEKYNNEEFEKIARGLEDLPECSERCEKCYRLRLKKSFIYAKENGYDYVTTTLSVSPHKNAQWLNEIGLKLENEYNIKYLCSDFKKNEGYKRSCQLSAQYNLYRQNYCGCIYSKRYAEKRLKQDGGRNDY
ncbi:MAG: epoxyqueuosine reductase QueH [Ruminococcaceae bacterium]|nr:epoxyqueuosine reductase QueH [Oscillospiraceae bacterium]